MWHQDNRVAVALTDLGGYPHRVPFDPPERYPEIRCESIDEENQVYHWVRQTLHQLGLDRENYGTPHWNPLREIVQPGMTVFIKPNTVSHRHLDGKNVFSMITHGSVVRPILDYVCIALKNRGRIIVGDAQVVFGEFDEAMTITGLGPMLEWYREHTRITIECFDLRMVRAVRTWLLGRWGRKKVEQDRAGYRIVDVGQESQFRDVDPKKLRIGVADRREMFRHHDNEHHQYLFPRSVLESDAIISLPKLKTHRRAGVTLTLKGFFGLVAAKGSLPHYTVGSPQEGGDEYIHPSVRKRLYSRLQDAVQSQPLVPLKFLLAAARNAVWWTRYFVPFQDTVTEAKWHGNDTIWRTLLDVYRAVFYADADGRLCDTPQRNHFCLLDGIVAGEGNGPVAPDPVTAGVLMAGLNPVAVDVAAASLMGFDVNKIPTIANALKDLDHDGAFVDSIQVIDREETYPLSTFQSQTNLNFAPHPQWRGHLERDGGVLSASAR